MIQIKKDEVSENDLKTVKNQENLTIENPLRLRADFQNEFGFFARKRQLTNIQWTSRTFTLITGCSPCGFHANNGVGGECDECYSKKGSTRLQAMGKDKYKEGFDRVVTHPELLNEPYTWKEPQLVFLNSMSDTFHEDVSDDFIKQMFKMMNETPQHIYQVLTKRHNRLLKICNELEWTDNIWLGVSVGVQKATRRIDALRKTPAKHKFLSVEPLLEEISEMNLEGIDWVIVGGESGMGSPRPMQKDWVLKVKGFCHQYNVPFFFKQWGKSINNPDQNDPTLNKAHRYHAKGGCMLDGKLHLDNPCLEDDCLPTMKLMDNELYVMDEAQDLKTIWELKSFMPMMEEELYKALKSDIKINGINDPILYWLTPDGDKLVIEGHTRLKAAIELKLKEIPQKQVNQNFGDLEDIKLWMLKNQVQRRNMSKTEKLLLAYRCKETIEKAAWINISRGGMKVDVANPVDTNEEIAKIAGVGRTMVVEYTRVLNQASQTVLDKVHKGDMSISAANKTIKGDPNETIKEKILKIAKKPVIMMLRSIEEGTELIKSGEINAVMLVKDYDQIMKLGNKQIKMTGFFIIERDAALSA